MTDQQLQTRENDDIQIAARTAEEVMIAGNLANATPAQRHAYYLRVCESVGLNPYTHPFEYLVIDGKMILYAKRDATDQLRRLHKVSIEIVKRQLLVGDIYAVTARATMPDGRADECMGTVSVKGLAGTNLANAYMKAETVSRRRVTLSIVGLGWLDENEVDTISGAQRVSRYEAEELSSGEGSMHWTLDQADLERFKTAYRKLKLSATDVMTALAQDKGVIVQRVGEYEGTCDEAIAALYDYASVPQELEEEEVVEREVEVNIETGEIIDAEVTVEKE
jgi:hypothetical protein